MAMTGRISLVAVLAYLLLLVVQFFILPLFLPPLESTMDVFISTTRNQHKRIIRGHQLEQAIGFQKNHSTIENSHFTVNTPNLPPALQVWKDYQEYHSNESLLRQPHNRTFQVVYYSCPHAAGNILHDFMNQVLVAVVLNRTLLVKYNDQATCNYVNEGFPDILCKTNNTEYNCNQILRRASWLPSFDEWKDALQLGDLPPRRNHQFYRNSTNWFLEERVIAVKPRIYQSTERHLLNKYVYPFLNTTESSRLTLSKLYSESPDFLFGMLFRGLFSINPKIIPQQPSIITNQDIQQQESFALHSRHIRNNDNGSNIDNEINCLHNVFESSQRKAATSRSEQSCRVYVMSDRQLTIHKLSNYIRNTLHCTPVVSLHDSNNENITQTTTKGHFKEHGPFAGTGFFQDLALASQARRGLIATCDRSSTQLLKEMIHFDRTMEALQDGSYSQLSALPTCCFK